MGVEVSVITLLVTFGGLALTNNCVYGFPAGAGIYCVIFRNVEELSMSHCFTHTAVLRLRGSASSS